MYSTHYYICTYTGGRGRGGLNTVIIYSVLHYYTCTCTGGRGRGGSNTVIMYSVHYYTCTCTGGRGRGGSNPVIYVQCTLIYMYMYRWRGQRRFQPCYICTVYTIIHVHVQVEGVEEIPTLLYMYSVHYYTCTCTGGGGRGGSNPVRQDRRETEENRFQIFQAYKLHQYTQHSRWQLPKGVTRACSVELQDKERFQGQVRLRHFLGRALRLGQPKVAKSCGKNRLSLCLVIPRGKRA